MSDLLAGEILDWEAITLSLYIIRMHTAVYMSRIESQKTKKLGEIHIGAMNHNSPKVWVVLQSADYVVTHVGKKYLSP
jgi:dihydroxyacetone kinase